MITMTPRPRFREEIGEKGEGEADVGRASVCAPIRPASALVGSIFISLDGIGYEAIPRGFHSRGRRIHCIRPSVEVKGKLWRV